ncbi:MAG: DUF4743 domain-containing protein [Methylocystaceae bacterium]|nr:DUF4743 domain-containing protein [Methylocystaceae bacterium]
MGFIDHIHACNNHDLSKFMPFCLANGRQVGWIRKDKRGFLSPYQDVLKVEEDSVVLTATDELTQGMSTVTQDLHARGLIEHWRDEPYKVAENFLDTPVFLMERAATPFFGIRAFGVHINGFVQTTDGLKMWIARRAKDRAICPGMLDNMVAGGQPAGLSLMENIVKECGEEANISADLAKQVKPVGSVSYRMETDGGLKPDVMFCYDLEVPPDFTPVNTDGEAEGFHLMDVEEVAEIVRNSFEFKFNCNLVIIDFLIRHGVINPDTEPDYEQLVSGLRR